MKKLILSFLTFCIILMSIIFTTNVQAASKVKLNKESVTIAKSKSITLKLKGTKKKVKWSTNNKKVATVTQKGKVTGKKVGTAKIVARIGKKKYVCKIQVVKSVNNIPVVLNKDNCQYYVRDGEVTITNYDYDKDWTSIIIPKKIDGYPVKTIGGMGNHKKLVKVVVPEGIIEIKPSSFQDCINLVEITIPSSVVNIAERKPGYITEDERVELGIMPDGSSFGFINPAPFYPSVFGGVTNLTIYGTLGSFAEEFANKEGIPFKVIKE